jgi:hypothetical protein
MTEVTMTCDVCLLTGGPFSAAEAAVHLVTHNLLHHRGAPVATVTSAAPAAAPSAAPVSQLAA